MVFWHFLNGGSIKLALFVSCKYGIYTACLGCVIICSFYHGLLNDHAHSGIWPIQRCWLTVDTILAVSVVVWGSNVTKNRDTYISISGGEKSCKKVASAKETFEELL